MKNINMQADLFATFKNKLSIFCSDWGGEPIFDISPAASESVKTTLLSVKLIPLNHSCYLFVKVCSDIFLLLLLGRENRLYYLSKCATFILCAYNILKVVLCMFLCFGCALFYCQDVWMCHFAK